MSEKKTPRSSLPLATDYQSPRWTGEIPDCSMPMTFDTYSGCAYTCLYCFSAFRRAVGNSKGDYQDRRVRSVDPKKIKRMFLEPDSSQFGEYIKARRVFQWGGLSDQFDSYEEHYGVTLELLRFFREIDYPISFSTKGVWWLDDPRYRECFDGAPWHLKISIITADTRKARAIERGVPPPAERLAAIKKARELIDHVTLRFRPFILGVSNPRHRELIERAAAAGADSVSTEFLCMETRAKPWIKAGYKHISEVAGFDLYAFYRKHSRGSGYLRLNREIKRPFIDDMNEEAHRHGMRFYVSDSDFKERCDGGSCCGVPNDWNWSRGQFTEAIVICRREGSVRWSDIAPALEYARGFLWRSAVGYNQSSSQKRAQFHGATMFDYLRHKWNNPDEGSSPYKYFDGVMKPAPELDENGDLVYIYDKERT
jgi:DNA repair photolyase